MIVDLDKNMLCSLIRGCDPSYEVMDHPLVKSKGSFAASYGRWDWNFSISDYSEENLWETYQVLSNPVEVKKSHKVLVLEDDIKELEAILSKAKEQGKQGLIVVATNQLKAAKATLEKEI